MSWHSDYRFRVPISVDFSGKVGSGTCDVTCLISPYWDHFWDNTETDGDDIRIMDSDGNTALDYEWAAGFDHATRTGTIEIDDVPYTQPCQKLVWLFYGKSDATDGSTSVTPATPATGVIELLAPTKPVVAAGPERPGAQTPLQSVAITKTDNKFISVDMSGILRKRCQPHNDVLYGEEISEVTALVVDTDDSSVASVTDDGQIRFVSCNKSAGVVVNFIVDGSAAGIADGSDYALSASILTSSSQSINVRVALPCNDVRPR